MGWITGAWVKVLAIGGAVLAALGAFALAMRSARKQGRTEARLEGSKDATEKADRIREARERATGDRGIDKLRRGDGSF